MGGRKEGRAGQEGRANFRLVVEGRNEGRCRRKEENNCKGEREHERKILQGGERKREKITAKGREKARENNCKGERESARK